MCSGLPHVRVDGFDARREVAPDPLHAPAGFFERGAAQLGEAFGTPQLDTADARGIERAVGDRSENEGDGGRGGGERRAPAEIEKLNISGRRRSRATEVEDEATHVADTGATGTYGGGSHEAKRRCAATTSATTAATSDAEATATRRAAATNKRKERNRDESAENDGGARNTRDTRVQEHCQHHAKHRRKSEEASGRPKATRTQGKAPAAARKRVKARHGTVGEEEWDSADEALSSDAARA
jgi:hypothetical protein